MFDIYMGFQKKYTHFQDVLCIMSIHFLAPPIYIYIYMGYAVAQLFEALRYKSEGSVFDSRWCHWNFYLLT